MFCGACHETAKKCLLLALFATSRRGNDMEDLPRKVHSEICSQGKVFFGICGVFVCKVKLDIADTSDSIHGIHENCFLTYVSQLFVIGGGRS